MKRHLSLILLFSGLLSMVAFDLRGADLGLGLSDGEGAAQEPSQVELPADEQIQPIVWQRQIQGVKEKRGVGRIEAKVKLTQKMDATIRRIVAENRDALDAAFQAAKARGDREGMRAVNRRRMQLAQVAAARGRR